jgi:hypothetical protein
MRLVIVALFTVLLPATATAQNRGIFVQAGPLADFLFSASTDYRTDVDPLSSRSSTYSWIDLNGDHRWQPGEEGPLVSSSLSIGLPSALSSKSLVAPGASAALGVFITPSISLRVEGSYQGEHGTETGPGDPSQLIRIEDRQSVSTTDVFVAAGWHQGESRRTTITYLGGMVFRRQRDEAILRYRIADGVLPPVIGLGGAVAGSLGLPDESLSTTSYGAGIMAGLDVAINFSKHLAMVPQIRMVAANHTLSVRPAIAMRWHP